MKMCAKMLASHPDSPSNTIIATATDSTMHMPFAVVPAVIKHKGGFLGFFVFPVGV